MYLSQLYPTPKRFEENESERFVFEPRVTARMSGLTKETADRAKALWNRFSCDASVLEWTSGCEGFRMEIGDGPACALNPGDRYALRVSASGVTVIGSDGASLLDGIKTLVQLIIPETLYEGRESLYMLAAEVHDSPETGFRAVHFCVFPGTKLSALGQAIHLAGFMKLTHVILEFWGTFPYECNPDLVWKDRAFSKADLRELIALIRSYGMEPIPMINHFGHATSSRGCHGRHVVLNRNQRLSTLFEPDGWTWCISNPDTYKLLAEMRAEQMEFAGDGGYFHLGFDEAGSFATCPVCRRRVPHELLAEYINRLTDDLCRAGRRPILWHDMFIRRSDFPAGCYMEANGESRGTYKALDLLDRRILMADWNYAYQKGYNPTTPYFIEKGFDTVICPWEDWENVRSICADVKKYGAKGVILTTWHHLPNFLSSAEYIGNCAWSAGENPSGAQYFENACLLRRLYDAEGNFEKSGWSVCEVEH